MTIAYTISTANYLPFAVSLGDSIMLHNPSYKFIIVLVDKVDAFDRTKIKYPLVAIEEMNIDAFESMNARYNIFELSCALKPFAASWLFKNENTCNKVFYFDSDMLVFNSLHIAEKELNNNAVLITPHLSYTIDFLHRDDIEKGLLKAGIYNAGFFGIANTAEGNNFLTWWKNKTENYCFDDFSKGLFVDQIWLNLAPVLFEGVTICNNDGYNVAYWNLAERKISEIENVFFANSEELVLFHFSGFDISNPTYLSKHFPYQNFETNPEVIKLFDAYKKGFLYYNVDNLLDIKPFFGTTKPSLEKPVGVREPFFKRKLRKLLNKM